MFNQKLKATDFCLKAGYFGQLNTEAQFQAINVSVNLME
jgi:hypothetical protein